MKKTLKTICIILTFSFFSCINDNPKTNTTHIPSRIVSLSPANTEILVAIGAIDQIITRTPLCNYPSEVEKIPTFGGFDGKTFNIESLLLLKPDFVYGTKGMHDHLAFFLEKNGIPMRLADCESINDVLYEIQEIGKLTNHKNESNKIIEKIKAQILEAQDLSQQTNTKKIYLEVWNNPLMTIGKNSFITNLFSYCNCKNIFSDINQTYPQISSETVIVKNPEAIFLPSDVPSTRIKEIEQRPGWNQIDAIKNNKIFIIDADIITRSGPRIGEALLLISKKLSEEKQND